MIVAPCMGRSSAMYLRRVSSRARILAFGMAGLLVVAGGACAAFVHGLTGQLLTIVLISLGLGGAVLLLFLEVGLSEDRERARETARRRRLSSHGTSSPRTSRSPQVRRPRRPR
jgi:hypothetical protein